MADAWGGSWGVSWDAWGTDFILWTEQSSPTEIWVRNRSDETDWDGGDTLWDVGVGVVRTVWDVNLTGIDWTDQTSVTEIWTEAA